ncbi:MAG: hypothetical protein ACYDC2_09055 [Solirubrobacteraceae bacterium]
MRLRRAGLPLVVLGWASLASAQSPDPAPAGWRWQPSLYVLASLDESADAPLGVNDGAIFEPSAAGNIAAGLDVRHHSGRGRLHGMMFGLVRSPTSGQDRSFFVAGRVEGSRQLAPGWTLTFGDSAKLQRRPQLSVLDFQRNEGALGLEWRQTNGVGVSVQIADRRRALPELQTLGFSRQAGLVAVSFPLGAHGGAEMGAGLQHYDASTVSGERVVLSVEAATFGTNAIGSLRYAWFGPLSDRRRLPDQGPSSGSNSEFGDIDRGDAAILSDSFFLDPIETDSDEWDFGRRKHVVAAFGSRRLTSRASLSGFVRVQHRRGPNLLSPTDTTAFTDDRATVRVTFRYRFSRRMSGLAQSSYLRTWSARPGFAFERTLLTLGWQVQF